VIIVVQVKLQPTPDQFRALAKTLAACNEAACRASQIAFEAGGATGRRKIRRPELQVLAYHEMKRTLSAQAAIRTIAKVADAYTTLRSNLRNGRYGKPGNKRYARAAGKPIQFRPDAAQPFDDRCLSWRHDADTPNAGTVSIWTTEGRIKGIQFAGAPQQVALLRKRRKGETDLVIRDGSAYLIATIDAPTAPLKDGPHLARQDGWLGVDMGIVNIAATSDGTLYSGGLLTGIRKRQLRLRKKLQAKGTKSAKRLLKARSRKEGRFAADLNHQISKKIVTEAERTGRGIAVEELTGIRERARLRKPQRVALNSWAFAQLGSFIAYKAMRSGVPLVEVDPAYTSQTCSSCGNVDKASRIRQATYICRACGVVANADVNAAVNIAARGVDSWAGVTQPYAARS
jgi:putative transposase